MTKPDQEIGLAAKLMEDKQVRRIPVVDASEKPIGLVSMNGLAICVSRKRVQTAA